MYYSINTVLQITGDEVHFLINGLGIAESHLGKDKTGFVHTLHYTL